MPNKDDKILTRVIVDGKDKDYYIDDSNNPTDNIPVFYATAVYSKSIAREYERKGKKKGLVMTKVVGYEDYKQAVKSAREETAREIFNLLDLWKNVGNTYPNVCFNVQQFIQIKDKFIKNKKVER